MDDLNDLQAYELASHEAVWDRLCDLSESELNGGAGELARKIARIAMCRVRNNIQILIDRWTGLGFKFGYDWANDYPNPQYRDWVREAPPLLGQPTPADLQCLDHFEQVAGPLPIVLRAFYEIVGAVNFVGQPPKRFPQIELIDPLQVELFSPQLSRLLARPDEELSMCPDHLIKYFIAGVGSTTIRVPQACFDPALRFEGDLMWNGKPLTFGRYLREDILHHGGFGLIAGCNNDAPDLSLLKLLTAGLSPF